MSWIGAAKHRNQRIGAIPYDGGLNTPRRLDLRNTGYLKALVLSQQLQSTYTTAGPTGTDALGIIGGPVSRYTLQANSVGLLFDAPSWWAQLISAINAAYSRGSVNYPVAINQFTASPALAATTNNWYHELPVSLDLNNKPWPIGFFQTALNSQETSLEVRFNPTSGTVGTPGSGIYTGNGANLTAATNIGSLDINQEYFDPIADAASQPSLAFIHQWKEFRSSLTADGDTDVNLPPANFYSRIGLLIVTGAANALAPDGTHLQRLKVQYGANLAAWDETTSSTGANALAFRMYKDYGFVMPTGFYWEDFIADAHNERDWFNSAATTNLRVTPNMLNATYSGGAYISCVTEQIIPLTVNRPGTAGVQGAA